jgi:hypothetical protein
MAKPSLGRKSLTLSALVFAGVFMTLIEALFVRSWSNAGPMYFPPMASAIATLSLFTCAFLFRSKYLFALNLSLLSSGILVVMALCFFIETLPITQGNNDSGEVFWLVALPMVLHFVNSCNSYLKLKQIRTVR